LGGIARQTAVWTQIRGSIMTAFNLVRFRVKPVSEGDFIAAHCAIRQGCSGVRKGSLTKPGDQTLCIIGVWSGMRALANACPKLIGVPDGVHHFSKIWATVWGVTDPVCFKAVRERSVRKIQDRSCGTGGKKPAASLPGATSPV
jgi:hypothetical protein